MTDAVSGEDFAALADVSGVVIEILEARNAELEARNAGLRAQVDGLEERLAKLERALSRNSGNSGMPPSSDDLPGRVAPETKPKGGGNRRPGKQKGTPGAHLAWSQDPDVRKDLFPEGLCGCGNDLKDAEDLGIAASHQVIDTPEVTAKVTQYDEHMVMCRCGQRHAAPPPPGAGEAGTVAYGPNVQAWAIFLLVMHHVPVERCADVIGALTGSRPSDGFVHSLLARAAKAVRAANMLIRALVITASVVCGDETPLRAGPGPKTRKKYLLVACTSLFTYYFLGDRSLDSFSRFVFADLGDGGTVLVHDRYQNYDAMPGVLHQLCTQHLLRDLEDCAQAYPDAVWPGQAAEALRGLIHAANVSRDKGLAAVPGDDMAADLRLFRNAVNVGLSEVRRVPGANSKQKTGRCLLECLKNREDDVLRFTTDLTLWGPGRSGRTPFPCSARQRKFRVVKRAREGGPAMSVYVGIDVHRNRSQVAVIDEGGKVLANRNVSNGVKPVLSVIGGLPAGTPAAYEAAFGWGWLLELLEGYGFEPHMVHPLQCKAIASARLKNDKVDAATLAQLLRADLLPEAWIAPPEVRQLRALLRHRAQLVRLRTLLRNRIHAILADHGHGRPAGCWSGPGRRWLASLELPAVSREVISDGLALADALQQPIDRLDAEVRQRAKADPRVKVLTQLPGVGPFTALVLLAEIGDISRFSPARKLASWAGLTPTVRGSDRTVHHGHISKQGPTWVRWVLCEAAQTAKRHPDFAPGYEALARRRGRKIATTAVARKLVTRAYHLLTDTAGEPR